MEIRFEDLFFTVSEEGRVLFTQSATLKPKTPASFVELQCAGDNHNYHGGAFKRVNTQERKEQKYRSHRIEKNRLTIVTASPRLELNSVFESCEESNAIRCYQVVKNVSDEEVVLEAVSSLTLSGIASAGDENTRQTFLHRYLSSHHWECQPKVESLFDLGIIHSSSSFRQVNVGSWSSKEALPQGILENKKTGSCFMFQIESSCHWYYEIGVRGDDLYLDLRGADVSFHQWCKKLAPGESFSTVPVAFCYGDSLNGVLDEMTRYRRSRKPDCAADRDLPVIFNEYMHLSWDDPRQERTEALAPVIQKMGAQIYVVDCGWHDEVPTQLVYPNVGCWRESHLRFPEGVKKTADLVHSLGMKFGLWIEPEIIGKDCKEMLNYYSEDCFFHRNGKKICELGRLFLDYRHPLVRENMTRVIDRMVKDYGADYIKFDYNQDCGPGTETNADSLGDGLVGHAEAFRGWAKEMQERHPHVIFENCASGGQRMDAMTLSLFPLTSTSDQIHYNFYPYIVANILTAVIPEQAAVWSYPVNSRARKQCLDDPDSLISEEVVVINMINSLLGRIHLASDLSLLSERKQELVKEGIRYYHTLTPFKRESVPFLPLAQRGYAKKGDPTVAVGIRSKEKLFLAVWNLGGEEEVRIPLEGLAVKTVKVGYPASLPTEYTFDKDGLRIRFTEKEQARLFEIDLK